MTSGSVRLKRVSPGDPGVSVVADAARQADGIGPFNEQAVLDIASGRRIAHLAFAEGGASDGELVAAAVTGGGELDLVVAPAYRRLGYGSAVLESLLGALEPQVSAWSHGDHPAARALAAGHGFDAVRTLLELRLPDLATAGISPAGPLAGIRIDAFDPERDAADWLELNARAFAAHPEQGGVTAADLAERRAEPWFDAGDFLVARDDEGRMLGFDWLKLEPGSDDGEVYVLGVDPDASRHGVGRALLNAGLGRMLERGRTSASLYVEGDNVPALGLYRDAGFVDDAVDVQYRRAASAAMKS